MDKVQPYLNKADNYLSKFPVLLELEKKSQIPKVYLVASLWLVLSASLFFNVLAGLTSSLIALVYPLYFTLGAVHKSDVSKLKEGALYFVLFSLFSVCELGDFVTLVIPFYYVFKTVFFVWLYLPQYQVSIIFINI